MVVPKCPLRMLAVEDDASERRPQRVGAAMRMAESVE